MSIKSKNFTNEERSFLIERITAKRDVIECDNPTFSSNQLKAAAFKEITEEFNSTYPDKKKNVYQIKAMWNRAKVKARKEKASSARSVKKEVVALKKRLFLRKAR